MSKIKKFVILLFILVLVLPLGVFILNSIDKMHDPSISTQTLDDLSHANKDGITNILIIGSDARPGDKVSRTDSMMILTIDNLHKDIKITSLARDTFVDIPGHGYSKLTHAYAFGKEDLLIQTIENNFDIDINDFVFFNFESFIAIIDELGGVTVDVTSNEIDELNKFIPETYSWSKNKNSIAMKLIEHPGVQTLNGYQALSFARIRHNDSAFGRDNRQRMIVMSILNKMRSTSKIKYPFIMKSATPYIKTNMTTWQMIKCAVDIMMIGPNNIKQMEFPIIDPPGYSTGGILGRHGWVLRFKDSTLSDLKNFIFNDVEFTGK